MRLKHRLILALLCVTPVARCQSLPGSVNLSSTTPAAPGASLNITYQHDTHSPTPNISAYALYPTIQVACPASGDLSNPVAVATGYIHLGYGGIIDARRCTAASTWTTAVTFTNDNISVLLPCTTLTATRAVTVAPGVRNINFHGCAYQGSSAFSGVYGGTIWNYQSTGPAFIVGDPTLTSDTPGFAMADMEIATVNADAAATAVALYRVQELSFERMYVLGNNSTGQTAFLLNGTGNYTGGTFYSLRISGYGTALSLDGSGTGQANASTFVRVHINCSTSGGSPIAGTIGVDVQYGDGNTFTGGDIEGCATMLHLGAGATNNTFVGVRNENSTTQVTADAGSSYNLWLTAGTMFNGKITDVGTHNSFADTFHRSWNNLNGDLWRAQADQTVVNHLYPALGLGHVRGVQDEYVTDVPSSPGNFQNAWLWGPGDGLSGQQTWVLQDLLNNVPRIGVQQFTTAGGNNQTFLNGAGTGSVCVNCSTNGGTGGFSVASGGATPATVASIDSSGNYIGLGRQDFYSTATLGWRFNCASTSACSIQSMTPTANAYHVRMGNGTNTELDSEGTFAVTVNNTSGSGTGGFIVYEGGANSSTAAFTVQGNGNTSNIGSTQVGNASGTGNVTLGNHLNQLATADFAGHCNMSGTSSCTVSFQHSWGSIPACSVTAQFNAGGTYWYTWATNVVTVHSSGTPTGLWAVVCAGDPN